jgi:hypothetical protein
LESEPNENLYNRNRVRHPNIFLKLCLYHPLELFDGAVVHILALFQTHLVIEYSRILTEKLGGITTLAASEGEDESGAPAAASPADG